jgi:hypothetical protein
MFNYLSAVLPGLGFVPERIFEFHPLQLAAYVDLMWERLRVGAPSAVRRQIDPAIGNPVLTDLYAQPLLGAVDGLTNRDFVDAVNRVLQAQPTWHHLIYGYLIENTRAFEVVERVLQEVVTGERLGHLTVESHRWARATEDLFFRDQGFFLSSLTSHVRKSASGTRRNAYQRMFNMDLNHGDGEKAQYVRADAANTSFVSTFEALLREVWRGYINARNTSGPNSADDAAIAEYAKRLREMLGDRRERGNLTREEFVITTMMSWFELTFATDTPIVTDLQCRATTWEERLRKVAARVGLTSHAKSRSLFELAARVSTLLIAVEDGTYDNVGAVRALYDVNLNSPNPNPVAADMVQIIIHWSQATGHEVKGVPVQPSATSGNGAGAAIAMS